MEREDRIAELERNLANKDDTGSSVQDLVQRNKQLQVEHVALGLVLTADSCKMLDS